MKIVVGIDLTDSGLQAARLAARLGFAGAELELVHVVERLEPLGYTGDVVPSDLIERLLADQETAGREQLELCRTVLRKEFDLNPRTTMRRGFAATELLAAAADADLLAVGTSGKGKVEGFLYGSVSRKVLSAAPCSVLIAKPFPLPAKPLRALIATDHSPYAELCIEHLIAMKPRGIGEATVLTAYPPELEASVKGTIRYTGNITEWIEKSLRAENQRVVDKLSALAMKLQARVVGKEVREAISEAAADADLIVVGAQGHAFFERWMVGSVSYAVATESDRHTLVLRDGKSQ